MNIDKRPSRLTKEETYKDSMEILMLFYHLLKLVFKHHPAEKKLNSVNT